MTVFKLRGLLYGVGVEGGSRLPRDRAVKLPVDTVAAARVPAGLHFAVTGGDAVAHVHVRFDEIAPAPAPTMINELAVWQGEELVATTSLDEDGVAIVGIPPSGGDAMVRIYLPEGREVSGASLVPTRGELADAPATRTLVAYGDSITQGWSVSTPGRAWPQVLGRAAGWDVVNLGFAGSARGETQCAIAIADARPDAVTIAWGTNAWSSSPTGERLIAETTRLFLQTIREAVPQSPIIVLSPLLRPDAENAPNRYGATLRSLRRSLEQSVETFIEDREDPLTALVQGEHVIEDRDLVDGVHPGDVGHAKVAAAVEKALAKLVPTHGQQRAPTSGIA